MTLRKNIQGLVEVYKSNVVALKVYLTNLTHKEIHETDAQIDLYNEIIGDLESALESQLIKLDEVDEAVNSAERALEHVVSTLRAVLNDD